MKILYGNRSKAVRRCQALPDIMVSSPEREVRQAGRKKDGAAVLREKSMAVALRALERLDEMLLNPDTSNAEALKAAALIFDQLDAIAPEQSGNGDYEICIKEE